MRFFRATILYTWVVTGLLAFGCNGKVIKKDSSNAGFSVSSFEATDIEGNDVALSDYLGKRVIVMSFWSTWCEPCKAEMPILQKLENKYGKTGLKILSISRDGPDTVSEVAPYIRSNQYTFTVIVDEDSSIAQAYNPRNALPFMVIIDRKGKIVKQIEGFQLSKADQMVAEISKLVEAK